MRIGTGPRAGAGEERAAGGRKPRAPGHAEAGAWLRALGLWEHLSGAWTAGDASWKVFYYLEFVSANRFTSVYCFLLLKKKVRLINNFALRRVTLILGYMLHMLVYLVERFTKFS